MKFQDLFSLKNKKKKKKMSSAAVVIGILRVKLLCSWSTNLRRRESIPIWNSSESVFFTGDMTNDVHSPVPVIWQIST